MKKLFLTAAMGVAVGALVAGAPALAADYFRDKTMTDVEPTASGGTFHIYCQLVQRNMGRHIPGNPKMIIQNRPGLGAPSRCAGWCRPLPRTAP